MKKGLVATTILVALVAVSGCGGSDSSSGVGDGTGGGEELTKAEFIEQADAICAARTDEREALQEEAQELVVEINEGSGAAPGELADLMARTVGRGKLEVAELRALTPPASGAAEVDRMLSMADSQFRLTTEGVAAMRRSDFGAFTEVTEKANELKAAASRLARAYGLKVCGAE